MRDECWDWAWGEAKSIVDVESGIAAPDLRKLLNAYQVDDEGYRNHLFDLARRGNERGWWKKYAGLIIGEYADLISMEEEARVIWAYEQELVPGLLQTADYARAFFRAAWPSGTGEEIDRRVEIRMERQEILTRTAPPPPRLHVVLGEGVLRRPVGGRDVMRRQIEQLMMPRDRANITIQVIPFDSGAHPAVAGPFTMMAFPDPEDLGIVNVENATGALFLEEPADVRAYDEIWSAIQAAALSADDSRAFLRSTSFGYRMMER